MIIATTPLFRKSTKLDTFYFLYLLIHIPITILIDSCLVLKPAFRLPIQQQLLEFHIATNKDFLLANPPIWLVVFGWVEVLFQLPFFFAGAYYLLKRSANIYPYMIVYGLEASTTTLACMVDIFIEGPSYGLNPTEINKLVFIYAPTFIIPFYMCIELLGRYDQVQADNDETKKNQ